MTKRDVARIEGEIFGLKAMLMQCLGSLVSGSDDPVAWLKAIEESVLAGIVDASNPDLATHQQDEFRAAAAGIVLQVVEGAAAGFRPAGSRPNLQ